MGKILGNISVITNIKIYGLNFYYDEKKDKVGFPTFYSENTKSLDHRVGHQFWVEKSQAKAIVYRMMELLNNGSTCLTKK